MANDWSMCLIAKTNPKWHAEKQIHHQEQELQARVTAVYTTTRWSSALFSCSMSGSSKPQSASQHLSSVTKQTTSCSCRKFSEWTHHHTRFKGSDGRAGMHIHQCAHKGRTHRLKRKNQKYIPRVLLGRWRQCNAIRWGHDGIYHEILHCPEALRDWRKTRWSYGKVKGVAKQYESLGVSVSVLGLMVYFGVMSLEPYMK